MASRASTLLKLSCCSFSNLFNKSLCSWTLSMTGAQSSVTRALVLVVRSNQRISKDWKSWDSWPPAAESRFYFFFLGGLLLLDGDLAGDFSSSLNLSFVPAFSVSSESSPLSSLFLSLLLDLRFLNESAPIIKEWIKLNQTLTYLSTLDSKHLSFFCQEDWLSLN